MPYQIVVMPDDELALIEYLRSIPQITALVPAGRITLQLASPPIYPAVLIQRIGGDTAVWPQIDQPAIQVDVVGGTRDQCKKLMLTVRAAILAIANDVVAEGVLSSASEEVGPSWLPDTIPVPPIPRYTARYRILLHP